MLRFVAARLLAQSPLPSPRFIMTVQKQDNSVRQREAVCVEKGVYARLFSRCYSAAHRFGAWFATLSTGSTAASVRAKTLGHRGDNARWGQFFVPDARKSI